MTLCHCFPTFSITRSATFLIFLSFLKSTSFFPTFPSHPRICVSFSSSFLSFLPFPSSPTRLPPFSFLPLGFNTLLPVSHLSAWLWGTLWLALCVSGETEVRPRPPQRDALVDAVLKSASNNVLRPSDQAVIRPFSWEVVFFSATAADVAGLHGRASVQGAVSGGGRLGGAAGPLEPAGGEERGPAGRGHAEGQPPASACALSVSVCVCLNPLDWSAKQCVCFSVCLCCVAPSIVCISVPPTNQGNLDLLSPSPSPPLLRS